MACTVICRELRPRTPEISEYRGGRLKATTTYAYGDGNLSSNDLDASTNVDPTKLYWSWLGSTFTAARQGLATPGRPIPLADDSRLG